MRPSAIGDVLNFLFVLQRSRHLTIFVSSLLLKHSLQLVQTVKTCSTRVEHKISLMPWRRRRLADGLQTRPNIVLPAGLSGFGSEVGQKRPRLSEASVFPLQRWHVEAPESWVARLLLRLKEAETRIRCRRRCVQRPCLALTLASRDWHFFDAMAGSVPRWVNGDAAGAICGPGTTRLSLGSSAG